MAVLNIEMVEHGNMKVRLFSTSPQDNMRFPCWTIKCKCGFTTYNSKSTEADLLASQHLTKALIRIDPHLIGVRLREIAITLERGIGCEVS